MKKIVMNAEMLRQFGDLSDDFEICDENGKRVGVLSRKFDPEEYVSDGPEPDMEELRALARDPGETFTTREILAHLRSLEYSLSN